MEVEPIENEPFRMRVKSARTSEWYLVDIQSGNLQGECNCTHHLVRLAPKISLGAKGDAYRCKHTRFARLWFLDNILPKLIKAMNMEDTEPEKKPSTDYGICREEFLDKHRKCAVYPEKRSTEVHHSAGKLNKLWMYQPLWIPVSREGHNYIHDHPGWARTQFWNGIPLLCAKGEWNKQP